MKALVVILIGFVVQVALATEASNNNVVVTPAMQKCVEKIVGKLDQNNQPTANALIAAFNKCGAKIATTTAATATPAAE